LQVQGFICGNYRTENLFSRPLGYSFSGYGAADPGEARQP